MAKVNYGKSAEKIIDLLDEVPKDIAGSILTFVAQMRGLDKVTFGSFNEENHHVSDRSTN